MASTSSSSSSQKAQCCVCLLETDVVLNCTHCGLGIHPTCYGLPPDSTSLTCAPCRSNKPQVCVLCPIQGGAMKPVADTVGTFAHVICALYVPETSFKDSHMLVVNGVDEINPSRLQLVCELCHIRTGVCLQCSSRNCYKALHAMCGRDHGLLSPMQAGGSSVILMASCPDHKPNKGSRDPSMSPGGSRRSTRTHFDGVTTASGVTTQVKGQALAAARRNSLLPDSKSHQAVDHRPERLTDRISFRRFLESHFKPVSVDELSRLGRMKPLSSARKARGDPPVSHLTPHDPSMMIPPLSTNRRRRIVTEDERKIYTPSLPSYKDHGVLVALAGGTLPGETSHTEQAKQMAFQGRKHSGLLPVARATKRGLDIKTQFSSNVTEDQLKRQSYADIGDVPVNVLLRYHDGDTDTNALLEFVSEVKQSPLLRLGPSQQQQMTNNSLIARSANSTVALEHIMMKTPQEADISMRLRGYVPVVSDGDPVNALYLKQQEETQEEASALVMPQYTARESFQFGVTQQQPPPKKSSKKKAKKKTKTSVAAAKAAENARLLSVDTTELINSQLNNDGSVHEEIQRVQQQLAAQILVNDDRRWTLLQAVKSSDMEKPQQIRHDWEKQLQEQYKYAAIWQVVRISLLNGVKDLPFTPLPEDSRRNEALWLYEDKILAGTGLTGLITRPPQKLDGNVCCVCFADEDTPENPILQCEHCCMSTHKACYGVSKIPEHDWYCQYCQFFYRDDKKQLYAQAVKEPNCDPRYECALCTVEGGALKPTDDGRWAHIVCAMWTPKARLGDVSSMQPIQGTSAALLKQRTQNTLCIVCGVDHGACITCSHEECTRCMHPLCAWYSGLYLQVGTVDINLRFYMYCPEHTPNEALKDYKASIVDDNSEWSDVAGVVNGGHGLEPLLTGKSVMLARIREQREMRNRVRYDVTLGAKRRRTRMKLMETQRRAHRKRAGKEDMYESNRCAVCFQTSQDVLFNLYLDDDGAGKLQEERTPQQYAILRRKLLMVHCDVCEIDVHQACYGLSEEEIALAFHEHKGAVALRAKLAEEAEMKKQAAPTTTTTTTSTSTSTSTSTTAASTTTPLVIATTGLVQQQKSPARSPYRRSVSKQTPGGWQCLRCISKDNEVTCIVCPRRGGAFKKTLENQWCHIACARWLPEVFFMNVASMSPIGGVRNISEARIRLKCYLCKRNGPCVQCDSSQCSTAFHPLCGLFSGAFMSVLEHGLAVNMIARCRKHTPLHLATSVKVPVELSRMVNLRENLIQARELLQMTLQREQIKVNLTQATADALDSYLTGVQRNAGAPLVTQPAAVQVELVSVNDVENTVNTVLYNRYQQKKETEAREQQLHRKTQKKYAPPRVKLTRQQLEKREQENITVIQKNLAEAARLRKKQFALEERERLAALKRQEVEEQAAAATAAAQDVEEKHAKEAAAARLQVVRKQPKAVSKLFDALSSQPLGEKRKRNTVPNYAPHKKKLPVVVDKREDEQESESESESASDLEPRVTRTMARQQQAEQEEDEERRRKKKKKIDRSSDKRKQPTGSPRVMRSGVKKLRRG